MPSVCVVLPTYNEEQALQEMIDRIRAVSLEYNILVLDSNSNDNTVSIARFNHVDTLIIPERGKGLAVKEAFQKIEYDVVVLIDSDASYDPKDIPRMLIELEHANVVIGSRFLGTIEKGAMSPINRFGNNILNFVADILYGYPVTDVCSGMWAFNKTAYKQIVITENHFNLEVNLFADSIRKRLIIKQVPISYSKRIGTSKLHLKHGVKIFWYLLTNWL